MELAPAPPVRPADDGVLLPAQFHYHQVSDLRVRGEQEGDGAVPLQGRAAGVERVVMYKLTGFIKRFCPKRFTILPNIHPFMHTFTHR